MVKKSKSGHKNKKEKINLREKKIILKKLDELLKNLPENIIAKFVNSEDFLLYEKVISNCNSKDNKKKIINEEINKVFIILDNLLEKLPEDVIKKFAKTENFVVYERILNQIKNNNNIFRKNYKKKKKKTKDIVGHNNKNPTKKRKKLAIISIFIIAILLISLLFVVNLNFNDYYENEDYELDDEVNLNLQTRSMTVAELNIYKQKIGVYEENNIEYNNTENQDNESFEYKTGLRPPTEEEWDQIFEEDLIIEEASILDSSGNKKILPTSIDHSLEPYFPPIGDQGSENSCVAWSLGYYIKTYQEAKEHNWDLSDAKWEGGHSGSPTDKYKNKIMSPDFIYHQINDGKDQYTSYKKAINIINKYGICSWDKMPYSASNHNNFPDEEAWRESVKHRCDTESILLKPYIEGEIEKMKVILAGGNLITISIDPSQYKNLNNENIWTLDNYYGGSGHANTVVGYDDNFGPYYENGKVDYGAFKIVNSYGPNDYPTYWISYNAMKLVYRGYCFEDKVDYNPQIVTVFQIESSSRNKCNLIFDSEFKSKNINFEKCGSLPFPKTNIVIDVTETIDINSRIEGKKFTLNFLEKYSSYDNIIYFSIEYYSDYESGVPIVIATSKSSIGEISVPYSNIILQTNKDIYGIYEDISISIENKGNMPIYYGTSSQWLIQKSINENWETIPQGAAFQVITQINPGEKSENIWDQKDAYDKWAGSGEYRAVSTYCMNDCTCIFTKYVYFSITNTISIKFNDDDITKTLTVTSVSPTNIIWQDIEITGQADTGNLGTNVQIGDQITDCSGTITIKHKPTETTLGTWTFTTQTKPFTPDITFYQNEEEKTLTITKIDLYHPCDINMDYKINQTDTNMITEKYGDTGNPGWTREDINNDGTVNSLDISILTSNYETTYTQYDWSSFDKTNSMCNLPNGDIETGDAITDCIDTITLIWKPTNELIGTWQFTAIYNSPPNLPTDESPNNLEEWINPDIGILSCKVSDSDGDTMDVSFYWSDDSLIGVKNNIENNDIASIEINSLNRYDTINWYVTINDGINQVKGPTWSFTVEAYDWDINRDAKIDDTDIDMLTSKYGATGDPGWIREDINNDGKVNSLDVSILSSHYDEVY